MDKPVHVILVDDEANILTSLKRNLFGEGYGVLATSDPKEALDALARYPVKVVVSDQRMPLMTGSDLLRAVKETSPDVVRILLTGHADIQAAEDAVNVGQVYRFMTKPWDPEGIRTTLRQAIDYYDAVTERRRLGEELRSRNEELEKANRTLQVLFDKEREFTSTVSHELRTPLAAIKMAMDILLSGTPGPLSADQAGFLNRAKGNVDRLHRLINDILDLTKMESGKVSMSCVPGDLSALLAEVVEGVRVVAVQKGLSLSVEGDTLPVLPFDRDRMAQVMMNLMGNALKFTEHGGVRVVARAVPEDNYVEVRVVDTGPGIRPEDMGKLFGKFQQLEGPLNNKSGGTGLGLAICKTIVEGHGGKIWVEPVSGGGAAFCFLLPIAERRKG